MPTRETAACPSSRTPKQCCSQYSSCKPRQHLWLRKNDAVLDGALSRAQLTHGRYSDYFAVVPAPARFPSDGSRFSETNNLPCTGCRREPDRWPFEGLSTGRAVDGQQSQPQAPPVPGTRWGGCGFFIQTNISLPDEVPNATASCARRVATLSCVFIAAQYYLGVTAYQ